MDFNAHNTIWDSRTDGNGLVIEELTESKNLVCINTGEHTRLNVSTGTEMTIDLMLVSGALAGLYVWTVNKNTTIGSDHYPITIEIGLDTQEEDSGGRQKWCFLKADWGKYMIENEQK